MREMPRPEFLPTGSDRRRTPRYVCGGRVQINSLPSNGTVMRGRLRNLGLGGCYIETASPFELGARTEVLVQVDTLCFRAMSLVRGIRGGGGLGMEFIRLSAGGHCTLAELIVDLQKLQALMRQPTFSWEDEFTEPPLGLLLSPRIRAPLRNESLALCGTVVPEPPPADVLPAMARCRSLLQPRSLGDLLDLLG
jgi:hypothetical protein